MSNPKISITLSVLLSYGCPANARTLVFTICLRSSGMRLPFRGLRISAPGVLTNELSHTPQLCSHDSAGWAFRFSVPTSSARAAAASRRTGCSSYRHKFDKSPGNRPASSIATRPRAYLTGEKGEGRVL